MNLIKNLTRTVKTTTAFFIGGYLAVYSPLSILNLASPLGGSQPVYAAASYQVLSFSTDKSAAARGETVTYSLVVKNNGDVNTTNVNVYEALRPPFSTYVNGSSVVTVDGVNTSIADAWYASAGGTNLGDLTPGQSLTFKWAVTVNNDAPQTESLENVINIKTAELQTPQVFRLSFTVAINNSRNSLCATKSVDKATAQPGDTVTYTIRVCNDGDITQTNVTLYDRLPNGITYKPGTTRASGGGNTITVNDGWVGAVSGGSGNGYNMGTLIPGQAVIVTFQVTVNGSGVTDGQIIENFGQVNSNQHQEFARCSVTFRVQVPPPPPPLQPGSPNCSLTKKVRLPNGNEVTSVDSTTHLYVPGEEVIYRLFISNPGTADATSFNITDTLPTYIFWLRGDGSYNSGANKVDFSLGTLKPGESRTLTYTAKVRDSIPGSSTTQTNQAQATYTGGSCSSSVPLVIGQPGQILAASVLPQTGAFSPAVLGTLFMVTSGLVLRLRRVKKYRYWNN